MLDPRPCPPFTTSSSWHASPSTARSPGCTAAPSTATAPSSASTATTAAGDDLKYVDWKLFARTDRLYTKQFRETTNVRMQVVLDASASMAFRGEAPAAKIDYGRWIAGAIAHLLSTQGDAAGLTVFDEHDPHVHRQPDRDRRICTEF